MQGKSVMAWLVLFVEIIGANGVCLGQTPLPDADLNGDGVVDAKDILLGIATVTPKVEWWMNLSREWQRATATPAGPTPAVTATPGAASEVVTINLPGLPDGARPMQLIRIYAGDFQMGANDPGWSDSNEQPVHHVTISHDFYLGETEVTQSQWTALMGSNPSTSSFCGLIGEGDCPVDSVSWTAITQSGGFLDHLNALGQGTFRLPTEAEWEYACRAGTTSLFPFGDSTCSASDCVSCNLDQYACWCANKPYMAFYGAVALKLPNSWGLYDMNGNLWEWVQDRYGVYPGDPQVDPTGPAVGFSRVIRGGNVGSPAKECRSAFRKACTPDLYYFYTGFRVVREVPPTPTGTLPTSTATITPSITKTQTFTRTPVYSPTPTLTWTIGTPFSPTSTYTLIATPTPGWATEIITISIPSLAPAARPLRLVHIPPGTFQMGSAVPGWSTEHEQPVHTVTIPYEFYLSETEVTQAQWMALMNYWPGEPCDDTCPTGDCPAASVGWSQITYPNGFLVRLSALGQGAFRLPSESEWEYACRAGSNTVFPFGDPVPTCTPYSCGTSCGLDLYAWSCGDADIECNGKHPVAMKQPNQWGLYDMLGNVSEFCQDYFGSYTEAPTNGSAKDNCLGGTYQGQVVRGGSGQQPAYSLTSAIRGSCPLDTNINNLGFRVALGGPSPAPTLSLATPTPGWATDSITINIPDLPVGARPLRLVRIPAGSFYMGSNDDLPWVYNTSQYSICTFCEQPVHPVTIAHNFYLGETEITQAQWTALMGSNPSAFNESGNDYPVEMVSWAMITQPDGLLDRLNALGQGTFRLPSEAEWEYACRAGSITRFPFGDSICTATECTSCELDQYAWWCGNNTEYGPKPVALKMPNPWGLYDMLGNVCEWCQDWWHPNYNDAPGNGAAWDCPESIYSVERGGCWQSFAGDFRASSRVPIGKTDTNFYVGLRIVREAP